MPTHATHRRARLLAVFALSASPAWFACGESGADASGDRQLEVLRAAALERAGASDQSLQPTATSTPAELGLFFSVAGDWARARDCYELAAVREPQEVGHALRSAFASRKAGEAAAAAERLERARADFPGSTAVLERLGDGYLSDARWEAADGVFRRLLQLAPESLAGHRGLGISLLQRERAAEAIASLERARALGANDRETLYRLGLAHRDGGNASQAQSWLEAAARATPLADPLERELTTAGESGALERAKGLLEQGEFARAGAELQAYAERHPDDPHGWIHLASASIQLRQFEPAYEQLERARKLDDAIWWLHTNRAYAAIETGREEEALVSGRRAVELAPSTAHAHQVLGFVLAHLKRPREARASLERALELDPDYALAFQDLAGVYVKLGENERALGAFFQWTQLEPGSWQAHVELAEHCVRLGRPDKAREALARAQRLAPDEPRVLQLDAALR